MTMTLVRCGSAGGPSSSGSPPPPPPVTIAVSPQAVNLFLGQQQQFTATVSGTSSTAVNWSVNNVSGGNSTVGTITTQGLYTAPAALPSNPVVTIAATAQNEPSASGTASVTIQSDVTVTVSPASVSVAVNTTQQFTAQVTGTGSPSTAVTWSLTGGSCPSSCGTLAANGNSATYTAPSSPPPSPNVTLTATSVADPSKSASATVTITASCTTPISISPAAASVPLNQQQTFTATVCSSPSQNVTWSITGGGCSGSNCGTVTATAPNTAVYVAPSAPPPVNPVTLVATSAADPTQSASASITVTAGCSPPVSISPSAVTVSLGQQQSFTATVCSSANQDVTWTVAGTGCNATNCGTVSSTGASTATYTAPASLPPSNPIMLTATSVANPAQSVSASITVTSGVAVNLAPLSTQLAVNHRVSFTAAVQNSANQAVSWSVNGVANGNASIGQICISGSSPCSPPSGPAAGSIDFLAPPSVPNPSGVYVTATAAADPSRSATSEVVILGHVVVGVSPANSVVAPSGTVEFVATVTGSSSTGVVWKVTCPASSCGTITSSGVYTAPATAPSPNAFTISVSSQDDPSQSASATVALTSAVAIQSLSPASVTAGAAGSFTLSLAGFSFVASSPGPATGVLVNGAARTATCASSLLCTITIAPADVASAGTLTLQAQNPDGSLSNSLPLVIVPADGPTDVISLTASQPIAAAKDVVAVEPTTAGSGDSPITVLFVGLLDTSTNTCNIAVGPVTLVRPASGSATFTVCLVGNALDPSFRYDVVGSQSTDVTVSNVQPFEGSQVQLTLTVSSSSALGSRTIVVTDTNYNRAVASGAIDVE